MEAQEAAAKTREVILRLDRETPQKQYDEAMRKIEFAVSEGLSYTRESDLRKSVRLRLRLEGYIVRRCFMTTDCIIKWK